VRTSLLAVAFTLGAFAGSAPARAYEVVDALGTHVRLARPPERIVTLAPSLGELAADVAGEKLERIVGVSEYTDYPPGLKRAASVGPYNHVNLEIVVSLKPDLVLATRDGNAKDQVEHLRELGLSVIVVETESFAKVDESMKLVAAAMGNADAGAKMAAQFETGLARIRTRGAELAHAGHHRVLLELGDQPLIVIGGKAFLNDALLAVGAENAYESLADAYPRPSIEDAAERNPDTILVLAMGEGGVRDPVFQAMAARWKVFPSLAAVRQDRVSVLQADALLRPSMRLLEGLSLLGRAIYGKF
jgi:iron complex transport system substrate-binding protein